jgi:Rrf2 family protein
MPQSLAMLFSKTKYALRAILRLAESAPTGIWLQTNDVAEQEQVPRKFLEAIFVQLRDHGIIESRRGAQGGHRLLRDPASVSVADVIRVLDGPLALTPCASRTRFRQCCRRSAGELLTGATRQHTQRSSKIRTAAGKAAACQDSWIS